MAELDRTPKHLDEALELAEILRPSWAPMSHELHSSGVLLNEGEGGDAGEGEGGGEQTAEEKAAAEKAEREAGGGPDDEVDEEILKAADNPDAVRNAIKAERERAAQAEQRAKEAEGKVREFEDRDKSEQEKAETRASEKEQEANEATAKLLRMEVAADKKLPLGLAQRLRGDTKEALEKDADALLKEVDGAGGGPPTDFEGGAAGRTTATSEKSPDAAIRRMAGR